MSILDIEDAIYELETAPTTYDNVVELASLYIVRDNLQNADKQVVNVLQQEVQDVLPAYTEYCTIKKRYHDNEVTEQAVVEALRIVGEEIRDLFNLIYSGTDMAKERKILHNIVETLSKDLDKKSKIR